MLKTGFVRKVWSKRVGELAPFGVDYDDKRLESNGSGLSGWIFKASCLYAVFVKIRKN
jgi:hypothetical protein